jgi:hypothetical protein
MITAGTTRRADFYIEVPLGGQVGGSALFCCQSIYLPSRSYSSATISYILSQPQHVNLSVYNLLGSRLATLVDGLQQPGSHVAAWDAKGKAAGVYLVRLEAGGEVAVKKMVMFK